MAAIDYDPDIVITVDDDNKPVNIVNYYDDFTNSLNTDIYVGYKRINSNKANPFIVDGVS